MSGLFKEEKFFLSRMRVIQALAGTLDVRIPVI